MKRFKITIISLLAVAAASAQSKIDLPASDIINATRGLTLTSRSAVGPVKAVLEVAPERKYSVIVTLDGDESLDGYDVAARRGDMAIVNLTAAEMEAVAALPAVRKLSLGTEVKPLLNNARKVAGVDEAQAGTVLGDTKYTGAGVIAGMMDQGVDINHINFLDADGEPRTTALWTVKGASGTVTNYLTPERIKNFTTENNEESHGTHVLGIMAGGYNGPADYGFYNERGGRQMKIQTAANSAMPYYGVATEAELAVACGDFSNSNIEKGAELVANYAKAQGKPCVVNLSVGNTIGPHDGTDSRSRWFERIGEDVIVCIAAGNDGDSPVSLSKTFTAGDRTLKSVVGTSANFSGIIDIWGADNSIYKVTFGIIDAATGQITYSYVIDKNLEGKSTYITGSNYTAQGYIHNDAFETAFGASGAVILNSNVDVANNRYEVSVQLQLAGSGTAYLPVISVEGEAGRHVDCYAFNTSFLSGGFDGYSTGDASGSINGLACGNNVLVVGSYDNVESWVTISGSAMTYNPRPVPGAMSSFSSYGTTFDGRQLPDVCGPGGAVVSSYSKYYVDSEKLDVNTLSGHYTGKTRDSYWGTMTGTSMATPFVSGVIATWLQADPTLTVADVKEIIARTATNDEQTATEAYRWGAGKINALAGLKDILGLSGIADVRSDEADVFISSADNRNFDILVAGGRQVSAEVYSLAGAKVASVSAEGPETTLSLDGVQAGVYVLHVTSDNKTETHKIAVK